MADNNNIDNIIFDLGGVLIRVGYLEALGWLEARGFAPANVPEFVEKTRLRDHETGSLDGDGFFDIVNGLLDRPVSREELLRWWTGFFAADEQMLALAHALRGTHRVFVLSNVGPLHWQQARRQFALDRLAHDCLKSYEEGVMKPDPAIYAIANERFGLDPAKTVFIDDLPENAAAGRDVGWHAIRHTGYPATLAELQGLGVIGS